MIQRLREAIPGEEFDHLALLQALTEYERPRDKITSLLRKGEILRIKKGIYVFGKSHSRRPFAREVLANMIYGPSYVSLDSALHYYGFIPEGVEAITSVCCGRSREFATPAGRFIYRQVPMKGYAIGIDQVEIEAGRHFLIATREKALADKLHEDRGAPIRNLADMQEDLMQNLRVEAQSLMALDPDVIQTMAERYRSRKIYFLGRFVHRLRSAK